MLVLAGTKHQVAEGLARVLPFFEDQLHLLGDRHFDAVLTREAECGARGEDAFSDFAAERGEHLRELSSLPQLHADGAVAAEVAGAGEDEVSGAREAGEGFATSSAGDGEAG